MDKILITGLINIETTLKVEGFPIEYNPANYPFFGIDSTVSGVGYNLVKAFKALGSKAELLGLVGDDLAGDSVRYKLKEADISTDYILTNLKETPQSIIVYDKTGQRQIHTDLKDIQDVRYPVEIFDERVKEASIVCLTNINFSRFFLDKVKGMEKIIATDVHTISDLDDGYNQEFMKKSDILFMSGQLLPTTPEKWAKKVLDRYGPKVLVIGLGEKGSLLAVKEDNFIERIPAVDTRPIVNTVGAGDSLFSAFIHFYNKSKDPYQAIKKATVFASYKIGEKSASEGFLSEDKLEELYRRIKTSDLNSRI
ncbi:carbohydrate kinase family protein [Halonatronum saccharophilum]|uniref:carbohydrate kinase family protein n=1 Tax=Halonatronum saccharophilum TaxID=150060 RepID=UPI000480E0A7|nr:carbohydrate kinase family protein [Halonatronum saccharophilum]